LCSLVAFRGVCGSRGVTEWSAESREALDGLKSRLIQTPILVPLDDKEPLLLYVAGTTQVVSLVLIVERKEG
jgi:hypothetical protein